MSKTNWKSFYQLIKRTKPSKSKLSIAIFLTLTSTAISLMIPLFIKNFIDTFNASQLDKTTVFLLLLFLIVQAVISGISMYMLNKIGQEVVSRLRKRLLEKYLVLPVAYYDHNKSGEMVSRLVYDTGAIRALVTYDATNFVNGILLIVGSFIILLVLDWKLTIFTVISLPLTMLIIQPLGKAMYKISIAFQDEAASFAGKLTETLGEIRLVKSSTGESLEYDKGEIGIDNIYTYGLREGKIMSLIYPLISFVYIVLLVFIIGYGGIRVSSGTLSAGELVAFILYIVQVINPMTDLSSFMTQVQRAKGATERIISILNQKEEIQNEGLVVTDTKKPIVFNDVYFQYEKDNYILKGVNFSIEPGKLTAIVGPSGAGKTTIFSLIQRYYDVTKGDISFGGIPISEYSLSSWRSNIGYVSQDSPVISGTIKDNIIYGTNREFSDEDIHQAAKLAFADKFILEFKDKYDTLVGERGIKLSGGQRQRIAIARAILRNPDVLMLDEATSNLDSTSEHLIKLALNHLMKDRTTIIIAHRLSTVLHADQIIFLDHGEITGVGTHEELLNSHAAYRSFAEQQLNFEHSLQ